MTPAAQPETRISLGAYLSGEGSMGRAVLDRYGERGMEIIQGLIG